MPDEVVRIVIEGKDSLSQPAKQASNALGGLQKAAQGSQSALGKLTDSLGRIGLAAMGIRAVAQSVVGLAQGMVGGNAEFEKYEVQFGVLLGSAEAAKKRLKELTDFARVTPFELPEVVRADKILTAFGLDAETTAQRFGASGEQIRTTIGDAASATGRSFEEIALAFGRFSSGATGEAIERFQELGLATRNEMAAWGIEFSKAGQMLTPAREAFSILEKHVREKFGGMMDAQSRTFEGMLSNVKDWIGQTTRLLAAPLFDRLKESLKGLLDTLGSTGMQNAVARLAGEMDMLVSNLSGILGVIFRNAGTVTDAVNGLADALIFLNAEVLPRVKATVDALRDSWDALSDTAKTRVMAIAVLLVAEGPLVKAIGVGISAVKLLAQAFVLLHTTAIGRIALIGAAVVALAALVYQNLQGIGEKFVELGKTLYGWGDAFAQWPFEGMQNAAAQFHRIGQEAQNTGAAISGWRQETGDLGQVLGKLGETGLEAFDALTAKAATLGQGVLDDALKKFDEWIGYQDPAAEKLTKSRARIDEEGNAIERTGEKAAKAAPELGDFAAAAKKAGLSAGEMVRALVGANPLIVAAGEAVKYWQGQIESVNLAIKANADQLKAAEAEYEAMQKHLDVLTTALSKAQERLQDLATRPLVGMGAYDQKIAAIERQLKRLKLVSIQLPELKLPDISEIKRQYQNLVRTITEGGTKYTVYGLSDQEAEAKLAEMKAAQEAQLATLKEQLLAEVTKLYPEMTASMREYVATLPPTEEGLQKALEQLQLMKELEFEQALDAIKKAAEGVKEEMTFEDVMKGITATKAEITSLTGQIDAQKLAMEAQRAVIDSIKAAGDALNLTLQGYQENLRLAEERQKLLTDALTTAYQWFLQDREQVLAMGQAGVEAAAIMDEKTRALLASINQSATDTTAAANATLATMVSNYQRDMDVAIGKVASLKSELNSIPKSITTTWTLVKNEVQGTTAAQPTKSQAQPAAQHGLDFTVRGSGGVDSQYVRFWATPGERVTVTPPGHGGFDYNRLAYAIVQAQRRTSRVFVQQINSFAGGVDAGQSYNSLRAAAR